MMKACAATSDSISEQVLERSIPQELVHHSKGVFIELVFEPFKEWLSSSQFCFLSFFTEPCCYTVGVYFALF